MESKHKKQIGLLGSDSPEVQEDRREGSQLLEYPVDSLDFSSLDKPMGRAFQEMVEEQSP